MTVRIVAQTTNGDSTSATLSSNNDCKMNTSGINDRPQRLAARRGRENVKNWVQALGGPPEDVTDTDD